MTHLDFTNLNLVWRGYKEPIQKHTNYALEPHKPWANNVCFYHWASIDLQSAKRVIQERSFNPYKSGANQRFEFNSKITFKWRSWVNKSLLQITNLNGLNLY